MNEPTKANFVYSRIGAIAGIIIGALVARLLDATPLAASIIITGILIGIRLDKRLSSWLMVIIAIVLVNAASILYLMQMLPFAAAMSAWVLIPVLVMVFNKTTTPTNNE